MPLAEIGATLAAGGDSLKKRIGPLYVWQYGVIGIGAYAVYRYVRKSVPGAANAQAATSPLTGQPISYDPNSLSALASMQTQLQQLTDALSSQANQQPVPGPGSAPAVTPLYDLATLAFNLGQAQQLPQFASVSGLLYSWQQKIEDMLAGTTPIDNTFLASVGQALNRNGIPTDSAYTPPAGSGSSNPVPTPQPTPQPIVQPPPIQTPITPLPSFSGAGQPVAGTGTAYRTDTGSTYSQTSGPGYVVQPGDTLLTLAARLLGDPLQWPAIYTLNQNVIGPDPNQVYPGMILQLPAGTNIPAAQASGQPNTSTTQGFLQAVNRGFPSNNGAPPPSNVGIPGVYSTATGAPAQPVGIGYNGPVVNQTQYQQALEGGAFQN